MPLTWRGCSGGHRGGERVVWKLSDGRRVALRFSLSQLRFNSFPFRIDSYFNSRAIAGSANRDGTADRARDAKESIRPWWRWGHLPLTHSSDHRILSILGTLTGDLY